MSPDSLRERLPELMIRDAVRLGRRLDGLAKIRDEAGQTSALADLTAAIGRAEEKVALRRAAVPAIRYPEELPVAQRRADLREAIRTRKW